MSDKLISPTELVTGGLLVIIGFVLAIAWDGWKDHRETTEQNKALNRVVASDLSVNKTHVEFVLKFLNAELEALKEGKSVVQPLPLLQDSFWEIVKLHPPSDLIESGRFEKLNKLMSVTSVVNDQIRSRENYRLQNGAMSNFAERMNMYDRLLIEQIQILKTQIDEYEK
jgi:hypothetical protein